MALVLWGILSGATLDAQALRGVVMDASSGTPIAGATIQVQPDRGSQVRRASTDSAGLFALSVPNAGLYTITATRIGYLQHRGDTVRIRDSETVGLRIELDRAAVPLRPLIVTERVSWLPDGFEERRAAGFGRFLTRKDIEARRGSRTTDLLRGMPGLVLSTSRPGRGAGQVLQMRGATGLCRPAIWIDGLYVADFAGMTTDDMLSPTVLEAVEVYNSVATVPVRFRTGNCGVVLFWTRRGSTEERAKVKWWKLALGAAAGVGLVLMIR